MHTAYDSVLLWMPYWAIAQVETSSVPGTSVVCSRAHVTLYKTFLRHYLGVAVTLSFSSASKAFALTLVILVVLPSNTDKNLLLRARRFLGMLGLFEWVRGGRSFGSMWNECEGEGDSSVPSKNFWSGRNSCNPIKIFIVSRLF